ncbi:uncharacterized protein [Ptychodera flava]|uniref:uncharacterized protein n=1 Tax=Ptychodera flava TaxID=63121 RepID=UPI00396AB0ED
MARCVVTVISLLCGLLMYCALIVRAGYGTGYGPRTCLCADGVFHTLDSTVLVRKHGCSLFDYCESCTDNPFQPCEQCPPNRYGPMCDKECDCGLQGCDDGVNGDGECHCATDEFNEGERCQYINKVVVKEPYGSPPAPQVRVLTSDILLSWHLRLFRQDPVVSYEVEYRVAANQNRYSRWTSYTVVRESNDTTVFFSYQSDENAFYKFRISAIHKSGRSTKGRSTQAIKIPGTPSQPSEVRIESVQGNSIIVAWDPPEEDPAFGSQVLGYVVQKLEFGQTSWITYADSAFDENRITISDLKFGIIYRVKVAARNKLGVGLWSAEESHLHRDTLSCFNRPDATDFRGRISRDRNGVVCEKWTDVEVARGFAYRPETVPGTGLGNHNFCRNPLGSKDTAWCYTTRSFWPSECDVGTEEEDPCPRKCAIGFMLSSTGDRDCVPDDETEIYSKVPLTNGEVCTCALQVKSTGEYLRPKSYLGWTYACAHALAQSATHLIENIYNMDADVCYEECIKSGGCEAFTYSSNSFNESRYSNESDIRLCTLFSDLNRPIEIRKSKEWTNDLSQEIPDDNYILSWGCWAADDPRNPSAIWEEVELNSFLVTKDLAFKNYTIDIEVSRAPASGLYISVVILGTVNQTTPINIMVKTGRNSIQISNINVGFISAIKITGQIGEEVTIQQIDIQLDRIVSTFVGDWCGKGDYRFQPSFCRNRGSLGGPSANTRLLTPTTTTLFPDFHGFACSSLTYSTSFNEAFFGWCPLTPKMISVGLPDVWPQYFVGLLDEEDYADRERRAIAANEQDKYVISDDELAWPQAVDSCLQQGRVLVKVLSHTIFEELLDELRRKGDLRLSDFWINGYNVGRSTWKTHDKQPLPAIEPSPWATGEPNLSGKCLQLWYRDGAHRFDDTICSMRKKYICQSQYTLRTSECKYNNEKYANTECVAMLNFNIEDMRNEFLEDKSVVVEEATLSLNFQGERHIRYLAIEGITEPWTRTSRAYGSIPPSVLIDLVDTNTTKESSVNILTEQLRTWTEEKLNGFSIAGRHGLMIRALREYQQAGFDDLVMWSDSHLRPQLKLKIQLYQWLVGPWSPCNQKLCQGGTQERKVSCIHAVTGLQTDDKNCRFHLRPHIEQSCQAFFDPRCYSWKHTSRPGSKCNGTKNCGFGTMKGHIICENTMTGESVPEYYCSRERRPRLEEFPPVRCSDFTGCTYEWVPSEWSECSDHCGGGVLTRSIECYSSNGTKVNDRMCSSLASLSTTEKCQDYSDCNVWESLQLLRQDQIYSDRSLVQKQINLTVPMVQAEAALMDAKQNIAEKELEYSLQTIRANLSIPEELAKAEILEAQARQTVAKNRIQTPTDGGSSYPNIGYLGRGYDIFYGNPRNDDGSLDPGFRQSVIGLTFNRVKYSSDRKFLVPDQADVVREMGSYFGSSTSMITSEKSYRDSLSTEVSVGGSYSGLFASGSFSASASYASMKQSTMNSQSVFVDIVGRVIVYDARLVPFNMDVSEEFREAVSKLPAQRCCAFSITCHPQCGLYDDFISAFGTHYTTSVLMGGRATQRYQMTSSSMEQHQSQDVGAGFSASGGFAGVASFSASASFQMSNSMSSSLSQSSTSSKEFFLGGEAGVGEISEGSSDSMKEWSTTVFDNPVPIQYKVTAVLDLLSKDVFPEDDKINDRQEVLRARYQSYCGRIPSARCGDFSKRDGIDHGNSVHFGDVVHLTMATNNDKQYTLQQKDGNIYANSDTRDYRHFWERATIVPESNKLCTWVLQTSKGPKNPHGRDWAKFMRETNIRVPSRSVIYTGISSDDCKSKCKNSWICNAGTHTTKAYNGFCILFTSPEHRDYRTYQQGKADDYSYHWSCYSDYDQENFGQVWRNLELESFRARYKLGEQKKMFSLLSPLSINNVKKEEVHFGDPLILVAADGVVTRNDDNGYHVKSGNVYDRSHMRFQLVNNYKPNGMPVKYGDDILLQEMPTSENDRPVSKLLMQPLPYYLALPSESSRNYRYHICNRWWWWWMICIDTSNVRTKPKLFDTDSGTAFTWNITLADIRGLIPQPSPPALSGLERVDFQTEDDGKSVSATVVFTRPVRRRNVVPGTVADDSPVVGSLPGYDANELISEDFVFTLIRGKSMVYRPVNQYFKFGGRQLTEYQLRVVFQDQLQDGDILKLELSSQIVSEDDDNLGGEMSVEQHIYLLPTFTVHVADATSLLAHDQKQATTGTFTLRVNFNKPVVNAERELPKVYDFEVHDIDERLFPNVVKSVEQVNAGCSYRNMRPCPTDFNVIVSSSFLNVNRKFYFDVSSGRLKSKSDFLFVNQRRTLFDLNDVETESEP